MPYLHNSLDGETLSAVSGASVALVAFVAGTMVASGVGSRWGFESMFDAVAAFAGAGTLAVTLLIARGAQRIANIQANGSAPTITVHRTVWHHLVTECDEIELSVRFWNNRTYAIPCPTIAIESSGNTVAEVLTGGKRSVKSAGRIILDTAPGDLGPGAHVERTCKFKLSDGEIPSQVYLWETLHFDPRTGNTQTLSGSVDWGNRKTLG